MIVTVKDDFDLEKIINSGQCFRPICLGNGVYRFIFGNNILYINQTGEDTYDISCSIGEWETTWTFYFDFDRDYRKIRGMIPPDDSFLIQAAQLGKGIRLLSQDPFEMLISFIISQRKSIPAIRSSIEKICTFYGKRVQTDTETLYLFPKAEDVVEIGFDKLSECSLGYRLPYVTAAIQEVASGTLDLNALKSYEDEDLLERLMALKGVGIKVASCVALFGYGRGKIAPVDTWIKRVIDTYYNGSSPYPGYGDNGGIYQQYAFFNMIETKGR